jgi:microcompartment protein CcmK/EutM
VAFEETALAPRTGAARKVTREERAAVVAAIVSVVEWRVSRRMGEITIVSCTSGDL